MEAYRIGPGNFCDQPVSESYRQRQPYRPAKYSVCNRLHHRTVHTSDQDYGARTGRACEEIISAHDFLC